ncbi:MAG: calcium/sodium antiporter [Candidatus Methanoplasma sp.]|nr:calcium/sodium antiporter [Candidatus Methanoplasma sp.]
MSWILLGIPVGIAFLYFGSEWMVGGAKKMAVRLGVTPFIIGLTVVALGSSAPEVVTVLVSGNNPQIILGNIVGSNIANVGLAIGLAALISPVFCKFSEIKFEIISMLAATFVITLMALTGSLGFAEGIVLVSALVVFIYLAYKFKRGVAAEEGEPKHVSGNGDVRKEGMYKFVLMIAAGIILLYFGARAFIDGAVELAGMLGVSDLMVGLIVVAVGASLPELCICIVAAYRKENELVVSNIVGSIVFNSFFALGVGVIYTTVSVSHYTMVFHLPVMVLMSVLMAYMIKRDDNVSRTEGLFLLLVYAAYIGLMFVFPALTQGAI